MSSFDVSVWWSLGSAISIAFARDSAKVTPKGNWRYPVSISVILRTGQGQGQVTKGHERSPKSQILFRACDTWFMITFHVNSKIEDILQSDSMKVNDKKGSGQPRVIYLKSNFQIHILNKKFVFLGVWSQDSKKCLFYFCAMSRNAENRSLKSAVINKWRFLGYMVLKYKYIKLRLGLPDVQVWFYNMLYFWKFWKFWIL